MSIVTLLLPVALLLGFGFLIAFIVSTLGGQYDDLETPAHRVLLDEEVVSNPTLANSPERNVYVKN